MNTNQSLSRFHASDEISLRSLANNIEEYISTENEVILTEITKKLDERPGLIGVLFPSKIQREHDKLTIQRMKQLFRIQEQGLDIYTNVQFALLKNAGNKLIASQTQQFDGELTEEALRIQTRLTSVINDALANMIPKIEETKKQIKESAKRQYEDLEQYKHIDFLYNEVKSNLQQETKMFLDICKKNIQNFENDLELNKSKWQKTI